MSFLGRWRLSTCGPRQVALTFHTVGVLSQRPGHRAGRDREGLTSYQKWAQPQCPLGRGSPPVQAWLLGGRELGSKSVGCWEPGSEIGWVQLCDFWPVASPLWASAHTGWNDEWEAGMLGRRRSLGTSCQTLVFFGFISGEPQAAAHLSPLGRLRAAGLGWPGLEGIPVQVHPVLGEAAWEAVRAPGGAVDMALACHTQL